LTSNNSYIFHAQYITDSNLFHILSKNSWIVIYLDEIKRILLALSSELIWYPMEIIRNIYCFHIRRDKSKRTFL